MAILTPAHHRAARRFRKQFAIDRQDEAEAAYAWAIGQNLDLDQVRTEPLGQLCRRMEHVTPKGVVPIPPFVMRTLTAMEHEAAVDQARQKSKWKPAPPPSERRVQEPQPEETPA